MNEVLDDRDQAVRYEIRYRSLFHEGVWLVFACDGEGHVDIDTLSGRARENYLYARAMVGRDYAHPIIAKLGTAAP